MLRIASVSTKSHGKSRFGFKRPKDPLFTTTPIVRRDFRAMGRRTISEIGLGTYRTHFIDTNDLGFVAGDACISSQSPPFFRELRVWAFTKVAFFLVPLNAFASENVSQLGARYPPVLCLDSETPAIYPMSNSHTISQDALGKFSRCSQFHREPPRRRLRGDPDAVGHPQIPAHAQQSDAIDCRSLFHCDPLAWLIVTP